TRGFDGCVITDWGGAHNTNEAIFNGLDIEMGSHTDGLALGGKNAFNEYYLADEYLKMALAGEVPMSIIDDKAGRILKLIFRTAMNTQRPWGSFATKEHEAIALKIAEEGIVLLKNDDNLLPVEKSKYNKIAVIGENAVKRLTIGGGSSELKVKREVSPLEGLKLLYGNEIIRYSAGYSSDQNITESQKNTMKKEALTLAKNADIVLFIGGLNKDHHQDSEGDDREEYCLPYSQNELIKSLLTVNNKLAIVILSGNAVEMPWVNDVPAILQGWFAGSEAGNAIAGIISGEVNPSGKLPFSFPKKIEHNAAISFGSDSYPGDGQTVTYKEDILVGYRWLDTKKIEPLFGFGHGLSYTTFKLGVATMAKKVIKTTESIRISISVTNTGNREGAEVIQLYIKDMECSLPRPEKELKAFRKVWLKPGQTTLIDFLIEPTSLQFYDDGQNKWVLEPGMFEAHLGTSSRNISSKIAFEVK
ncbi:MAG: glycosyl hydrolase, partial [Bacteroidales bacterium]|nr:glycosyl hydrolase [Bacteroidales bacterium]